MFNSTPYRKLVSKRVVTQPNPHININGNPAWRESSVADQLVASIKNSQNLISSSRSSSSYSSPSSTSSQITSTSVYSSPALPDGFELIPPSPPYVRKRKRLFSSSSSESLQFPKNKFGNGWGSKSKDIFDDDWSLLAKMKEEEEVEIERPVKRRNQFFSSSNNNNNNSPKPNLSNWAGKKQSLKRSNLNSSIVPFDIRLSESSPKNTKWVNMDKMKKLSPILSNSNSSVIGGSQGIMMSPSGHSGHSIQAMIDASSRSQSSLSKSKSQIRKSLSSSSSSASLSVHSPENEVVFIPSPSPTQQLIEASKWSWKKITTVPKVGVNNKLPLMKSNVAAQQATLNKMNAVIIEQNKQRIIKPGPTLTIPPLPGKSNLSYVGSINTANRVFNSRPLALPATRKPWLTSKQGFNFSDLEISRHMDAEAKKWKKF